MTAYIILESLTDSIDSGISTDPSVDETRLSGIGFVEADAEVVMRNSVRPGGEGDGGGVGGITTISHPSGNADTASGEDLRHSGRQGDVPDGADVFSKEAFEPLLTSNQYQVRKLAAQALMDVALMMANISQLRTLIALGPDNSQNFYVMTSMVACSLMCQILFAILMFIILMRETDMQQKKDYLDNLKLLEESGVSRHTTARVRESVLDTKAYKHQVVTGHLNYVTMVLVFLITVLNMFITGFGIKSTQ